MAEVNNLIAQLIINILPYNNQHAVLLINPSPTTPEWSLISTQVILGETVKQAVFRIIQKHLGFKADNVEFINNLENFNISDTSSDQASTFLNFAVAVDDQKITDKLDPTQYHWLPTESEPTTLKITELASQVIQDWLTRQTTEPVDYYDQYQRSLADYQNLLKKTNRDKEEFAKFALNDFLQELLPAYDHLKLSISSLPQSEQDNAWVAGVNHVLRQFKEVLNSHGVQEIVTVGATFDHHTMEAIEGQGEVVVKELSPGYQLNGRLLKPAKVIVATESTDNQ